MYVYIYIYIYTYTVFFSIHIQSVIFNDPWTSANNKALTICCQTYSPYYFADEPHCCCGTQITGKDEWPRSQRTGKIYHKYVGYISCSRFKISSQICNLTPFLPSQLLQLCVYSLMKPESFFGFNIATFQLNVLCSPASAVLTTAAPPKGSVYGLWILHSGLYTTEFGKTISDTFFTVNCNFLFVHACSL